jgi:hypothetical protein
MRSKPQAKSVARKPRKNMQVHMKDLLHRCLAISQEKVDALALHATAPDRRGYSLTLLHQPARSRWVEVGQIRGMAHWNNQNVAWIYRLNIQERGALLVAKEERGRQLAGQ